MKYLAESLYIVTISMYQLLMVLVLQHKRYVLSHTVYMSGDNIGKIHGKWKLYGKASDERQNATWLGKKGRSWGQRGRVGPTQEPAVFIHSAARQVRS